MDLRERLKNIWERVEAAALRAHRNPLDVSVMLATKRRDVAVMQQVIDIHNEYARPALLGESYVQEAKAKRPLLRGEFSMHLIGALQRNKAKEAVGLFDLIEALHSRQLALALDAEAQKQQRKMAVFLQVNISEDLNKSGFSKQELWDFMLQDLPKLGALSVRGLMTITARERDPQRLRQYYREMAELRHQILQDCGLRSVFAVSDLQLSMGMSDDFELAIEEGATIVRIGTALFGPR